MTIPDPPARREPTSAEWRSGESMTGGVSNAGLVRRVGDAVVRPSGPHTPAVHEFLRGLRRVGFQDAPLPLELRTDGTEVLEYLPGEAAVSPYPTWMQSDASLKSIGRIVRRFHAAALRVDVSSDGWNRELADEYPTPDAVCHNDLCPENLVFSNGQAVGIIDFDFAAPGRQLFDLAKAARRCVPIDHPEYASRSGWLSTDTSRRLRLFVDAYGLSSSQRYEFVDLLRTSIVRGGDFVRRRVQRGDESYVKLWRELGGPLRQEMRLAWFDANRASLESALRS